MPDSALFTPLTLGTEFRNRLWVVPCASTPARTATACRRIGTSCTWFLRARRRRAGRRQRRPAWFPRAASALGHGLWNDDQRDGFAPDRRLHSQPGRAAGIQLAHAGARRRRTASGAGEEASRSRTAAGKASRQARRHSRGSRAPRAHRGRRSRLWSRLRRRRRRAVRPGSTSSTSTPRTDTSCTSSCPRCPTTARTSTAARLRTARGCILEIVRAVRAGWASPPAVRALSATDWVEPDGWTSDETHTVAGWAARRAPTVRRLERRPRSPESRSPRGPAIRCPSRRRS